MSLPNILPAPADPARIWLLLDREGDRPPDYITDESHIGSYAAKGWTVVGPYVPASPVGEAPPDDSISSAEAGR